MAKNKTIKKSKKKAEAVLPVEVIMGKDEALPIILKYAHENVVSNLEQIARATGIDIKVIEDLEKTANLKLVELSQFKETFLPTLEANSRKLMLMIDNMTERGGSENLVARDGVDPFILQKLISSLKTVRDIQKNERLIRSAGVNQDGNKTTIRIHKIVEIIEEHSDNKFPLEKTINPAP